MPKLAYTPVFGSGFSFDTPYDQCFGLFTCTISDARQVLQQLCRCRHLGSILLCVKPSNSPPKFDCGAENVATLLKEYNKQPSSIQNMLKAALSQDRKKATSIPMYFAQEYKPWLLKLLADSVSERLLFMQNPVNNIKDTMKENHPLWQCKINTSAATGSRPVDKQMVNDLKDIHSDFFFQTDLVSTKHGDMLCMDQAVLKKRAKELGVLGAYELKDLSVSSQTIMKALNDIIQRLLNIFCLFFGPFNVIHRLMYANACIQSQTLNDEQKLYDLVIDLFEALSWDEHIVRIDASRRKSFTYLALDMDQANLLQLTTKHIIGRWKPLVEWQKKHHILMAHKSLSTISLSEASLLEAPESKTIQNMTKAIIGVFRMAGLEYRIITEKSGKSYPKRNLGPLVNALKRDNPETYSDDTCPNEFSQNRSVATHIYAIDIEDIWKYMDLALRNDIQAFCMTENPLSRLQAYTMNQNANLNVALPETVIKPMMQFIKTQISPRVKAFMKSPSYWFVTDPTTYNSQDLLINAYEQLKEQFELFWVSFGYPSETVPAGGTAANPDRIEHQLIRRQKAYAQAQAYYQPMMTDSDEEASVYVRLSPARTASTELIPPDESSSQDSE
jgi:hypothetical protein